MHVVFRESQGLEDTAPSDPGQSPADLVVLSFSDSDLGAFAAGWRRADGGLPSLRLLNLAVLRHPLSVDAYVERTLAGARGILIRLIGGASYWPYGLVQVQALAREKGIALAVLPGDGRPDPQLDAASTVPGSVRQRLAYLCDLGGATAAQAALQQLALAAGLYAPPVAGARAVAPVGGWQTGSGLTCPAVCLLAPDSSAGRPLVVLTFYRSYLTAADLDPLEALSAALAAQGFAVLGLFVPSLKEPDARRWLARWVAALTPVAIVNATAFAARGAAGVSPLEAADVPVFQVALATNGRLLWQRAARGLSPADLAMHVVLPEVDGRIFAGVASFKEMTAPDPQLQFSRAAHRADAGRVAAIAARLAGWVRLGRTPPEQRRLALVLSTYPGRDWQMAHAVGLDAPASAAAILADLAAAGYAVADGALPGPQDIPARLAVERQSFPLTEYEAALDDLPPALRQALIGAWGAAADDPACRDGAFHFAVIRSGAAVVALQPERGGHADRADIYHDLSRVPRHAYVAFYLWLRRQNLSALLHIGAHGTLEWLPGKSVALSEDCWPEALTGPLPVIYPFIVNDPGEAAQAKRRLAAVTLGHAPPPPLTAGAAAGLTRLEALLDEFSGADGLDPARRDRLQLSIRAEAEARGLAADLGLDEALSPAEAVGRIDRFVCDIKDSQFGDGLHVFGRGEAGAAERAGLLRALDGRFVPPGPAGSPWRGRADVLPTGRNLFSCDPRALPTRAAVTQGRLMADELLRRHLQDHGDWPRTLVVDLWGSATMRTAGEDFAMALHLMGVAPVWDDASGRVSGFDVLSQENLGHPRIDVTLRVSGLFRDVFPDLCALFGQAVRALAALTEAGNPFLSAPGPRVYGPAPGSYGLAMGDQTADFSADARQAAGRAWLAASAFALDAGDMADPQGLAARVAASDAFVHAQDLPESDLLLAADYAAHEGGFAAANRLLGGRAALYHLDARNPQAVRARSLSEEIARVVRARAANPRWLEGMRRHGFRGGAEIAATLEHLAAFAHLSGSVPPHLFDLYAEATLGDPSVRAFLAAENPQALAAMQDCFERLRSAGLWQTRRNSLTDLLAVAS
jgi:cobaltochelatase CobN